MRVVRFDSNGIPGDDVLEAFAEFAAVRLAKLGIPAAVAKSIALDAGAHACKQFAGCRVYFRKGMDLAERDARIIREHTGRNCAELASHYGISRVRVYQILKRERNKRGRESAVRVRRQRSGTT